MDTTVKEVAQNLSLETCLTIPVNLPADFYQNPIYDQHIDNAIAASTNLVYDLDEEGEKKAKGDATSLNKYATLFDKFTAAVYKTQTEQVSQWRDNKKTKVKALLANRQKLIDQFAERRQEKLTEIEETLTNTLSGLWIQHEVKQEFQIGDINPLVTLTGTLTPGGQLTKKAKNFLNVIVSDNLAQQRKIEKRLVILENRCLREEINPPLMQAHFGTVFYASDEIFQDKLDFLIAAEVDRMTEMKERLIKQQEAENQRKLEAALKAQQDEANRIAREEALRLRTPLSESKGSVEPAAIMAEGQRKTAEEKKLPPLTKFYADDAKAVTGKRKVRITAVFDLEISNRVSNAGAELYLRNKLPAVLADCLIECSSKNG